MKLCIGIILCFGIFTTALPTDKQTGLSVSEILVFVAAKNGSTHGTSLYTPLHYAAEHSNAQIVDSLIQKGADVNVVDQEGLSAVHFAALNDNEDVMEMLIKHKGDINKADKRGYTPLHLAALNSNEKVMELLLISGANFSACNYHNETALHWAAVNPNEKVADLLIKKGIDVNHQNDDGHTALHISALGNSNEKITDLLIKAGANVSSLAKNGCTPVFYALYNGKEKLKSSFISAAVGDVDQTYAKKKARECLLQNWKHPVQEHAGEKIIELLVKGGADINQKNTKGIRAYDAAVGLGDERMKAFLVKHGAKTEKQS